MTKKDFVLIALAIGGIVDSEELREIVKDEESREKILEIFTKIFSQILAETNERFNETIFTATINTAYDTAKKSKQ